MVVVLNADSNTFASLQPLCEPVLEVLQKQAVAGPVIISAKNL